MSPFEVEIRPAADKDIGFIWATFRDSYRDEQPDMTNDDYEAWARERQPDVDCTMVAHEAGAPDLLVGWASAWRAIDNDGGTVLYAYVRKERRKEGIATRLVRAFKVDPTAPLVVLALTRTGRRIKAAHPNIRYVPR